MGYLLCIGSERARTDQSYIAILWIGEEDGSEGGHKSAMEILGFIRYEEYRRFLRNKNWFLNIA
jgi:hypothetical protein